MSSKFAAVPYMIAFCMYHWFSETCVFHAGSFEAALDVKKSSSPSKSRPRQNVGCVRNRSLRVRSCR